MAGPVWRRIVWCVVLGASLRTGVIPAVAAQEASPAAGASLQTACTLDPRPVDALVALWFGPTGAPLAPPAETPPVPSAADLPPGAPADAPTVAAITATLDAIFACFDAGQYARGFALMTDEAIRQLGPAVIHPEETTPEEVRALLAAQLVATPTAGEPTAFSAAREARVLPDGRVGAIFTSGGDAIFVLFVPRGDRWLLDGFIDISEAG